MRNVFSIFVAVLALGATGCELRRAMYDQPKYQPLQESDFFGDSRSARLPVAGTVARGQLNDDEHLVLGKVNGQFATTFPEPVTKAMLVRGRERYDIYCALCHDRAGTGNGMIAQRGFKRPPSYHQDRLRQAPPGYFFDVITHGFGQMPAHADLVPVADRWAIVAYIRALQLSQYATTNDVPEAELARLVAEKAAP